MSEEHKLKQYIGKTLKTFTFKEETLYFDFEDAKELTLYAVGDCCSSSWFESISGQEALVKGATILSFEFVDLRKVIEKIEDGYMEELIQFYSVKIKTTKGYVDVEMRNSSNGYYGGYITINTDDQYSMDDLNSYYGEIT
jgi:hypothetical protein